MLHASDATGHPKKVTSDQQVPIHVCMPEQVHPSSRSRTPIGEVLSASQSFYVVNKLRSCFRDTQHHSFCVARGSWPVHVVLCFERECTETGRITIQCLLYITKRGGNMRGHASDNLEARSVAVALWRDVLLPTQAAPAVKAAASELPRTFHSSAPRRGRTHRVEAARTVHNHTSII